MKHSIREIIKKSALDSRYPTIGEYDTLEKMNRDVWGFGNRLEAAKLLKDQSTSLVSNSLRELLKNQPNLLEKGGLLSDPTRLSEYISELDKLLRMVQYCVLESDKEQIFDLRANYINIGLISKAIELLQRNVENTLVQDLISYEVQEFIHECFNDILNSYKSEAFRKYDHPFDFVIAIVKALRKLKSSVNMGDKRMDQATIIIRKCEFKLGMVLNSLDNIARLCKVNRVYVLYYDDMNEVHIYESKNE